MDLRVLAAGVCACFNGATAVEPWKSALISMAELAGVALQWGHGC